MPPLASSGAQLGQGAADPVDAVDLLDAEAHVGAGDAAVAGWLARIGIGGVVLATGAIALLHFVEPSRSRDPLSSTISEYALLPNGWIFDWAVVLLAVSSLLVVSAMAAVQIVRWRSLGVGMMLGWSIGLVGLVVFPKHGFGADSSFAGRVHWTWTLIAFFSLPIGTCLMCWAHRKPSAGWPRWALRLSLVSGGWFLVLTGQTLLSAVTPVQAWRLVGLVERALSVTEMAVVVVLGLWVLDHCRVPAPLPVPPA